MLSASVQTQCPSTICSSSSLRNPNSVGEWAAHRPLPLLYLQIPREIHQVVQQQPLEAVQPVKQRRIRLLKRLLKRRAIQRRIEGKVEVKVEVEIQAKTHVPTQRTTPVSIHRRIRSGIRGDLRRKIPRAFQRDLWRGLAAALTVAFARAAGVLDRLLDPDAVADSVHTERPRQWRGLPLDWPRVGIGRWFICRVTDAESRLPVSGGGSSSERRLPIAECRHPSEPVLSDGSRCVHSGRTWQRARRRRARAIGLNRSKLWLWPRPGRLLLWPVLPSPGRRPGRSPPAGESPSRTGRNGPW